MAEALYRKYRPQVFADVVGQEPIERTLRNALEQNKISHAYLFCGPRGTGKTTTARLLAKALLCEKGPTPEPDGTCEDCRMIADGTHPDVYELDAASRTGVENMREEVIGRVQFAPTRGSKKVYIIDEVHMLSIQAFNALLKTLEEPPEHVVFILCTTDPQKVPETVHSRCQRFDFRRIAPESMVARLGAICVSEGVEFEGEALDLIAHRADGGLRNALTSLEQIIAFEGGSVTLAGAERLLGSIDSTDMAEIMAYIGKRDIANCLRWTAEYVETGSDLAQFVRDMAEHVRDLYVMAVAGEDVELDVTETMRRQLASELQWFGPERTVRCMGVLGDLMAELKTSSNPRLSFEIALTRLVRPDSDLTLEALAERIEALESGYSAVAHVLPGNPVIVATGEAAPAAGATAPVVGSADAQAMGSAEAPTPSGGPAQGEPVQGGSHLAADARVAAAPDGRLTGDAEEKAELAAPAPAAASSASAAAAAPAPAASATPASSAPASASAAPASASGGASPFANPATLQRTWQAAMVAVKKHKIAYGALFMNTRITFNESAGAVEIEFPAESTFAYNAVQKQEARDALASAWQKAAGSAMRFVYKLGGDAPAAAQMPAAAATSRATVVASAPASAAQASAPTAQAAAPAPAEEPASAPAPMPASAAAPAYASATQAAASASASAPTSAVAHAYASAAQASQGFAAPTAVEAPYDDMPPYEQVPYEELGIDETAYGDYGSAPVSPDGFDSFAGAARPAVAETPVAVQQPAPAATAEPSEFPVQPAPAAPAPAPQQQSAAEMSPADLEALLQAGFGSGVRLEAIDEE